MFQKVIGQKPESGISPAAPPASDPSASSSPPPPPLGSHVAPPRPGSHPGHSGRNVLSTDVEIKGSIKFENDLVVDGRIEGQITSDGSLTVGENARIKAEIKTRSVVIYGKVHGGIEVTDSIELKANAELVGDIKAASLSIEPGAVFVGKSTVGTPSLKPQQQPAASSPAANNSNKSDSNTNTKKDNTSSGSKGDGGTSELPLSGKTATENKAVSS